MLKITDLSKNYTATGKDNKIKVFSEINLNIKKGETVAILGQSGSGKSTLLSLIAGLEQPSTGEIFIDDVAINSLKESQLAKFRAKHIGIIFQQFHLMPHLTALENVSLPLELSRQPDAQEKALHVLKAVHLEHRINHFPHTLSGGECQRVAIARAIIINPSILLADEPTGNLDEKNGERLANILFQLVESNNMTLLLVTHNHSLGDLCDRKILLKEGSLHEDMA